MDVNLAQAIDTFAENLTWNRYDYEVDFNQEMDVDWANPTTNTILGVVQTLSSEIIWEEGGTIRDEDRQLFVHYPVRDSSGTDLTIELMVNPNVDESSPYIDIITYEGQEYDIVGIIDDYKEANYQSYLLTRVSNT